MVKLNTRRRALSPVGKSASEAGTNHLGRVQGSFAAKEGTRIRFLGYGGIERKATVVDDSDPAFLRCVAVKHPLATFCVGRATVLSVDN